MVSATGIRSASEDNTLLLVNINLISFSICLSSELPYNTKERGGYNIGVTCPTVGGLTITGYP